VLTLAQMTGVEIVYSGFRSPFITNRNGAATNGALVGMFAFSTLGAACAFALGACAAAAARCRH
jgi:hypothetical protein